MGPIGADEDAYAPTRFRGRSSGVSTLRRHLNALAAADPEAIRKEVIAAGRDPFIDGIVAALKDTGRFCYSCKRSGKEKWAFRLFAELADMVGSGVEIAVQVVNLVGAQPREARGAVDMMRRVEAATDDDLARASFAALDRICEARGQDAVALRASLEVHTNGDGG
jgi:hypothetical protein